MRSKWGLNGTKAITKFTQYQNETESFSHIDRQYERTTDLKKNRWDQQSWQ